MTEASHVKEGGGAPFDELQRVLALLRSPEPRSKFQGLLRLGRVFNTNGKFKPSSEVAIRAVRAAGASFFSDAVLAKAPYRTLVLSILASLLSFDGVCKSLRPCVCSLFTLLMACHPRRSAVDARLAVEEEAARQGAFHTPGCRQGVECVGLAEALRMRQGRSGEEGAAEERPEDALSIEECNSLFRCLYSFVDKLGPVKVCNTLEAGGFDGSRLPVTVEDALSPSVANQGFETSLDEVDSLLNQLKGLAMARDTDEKGGSGEEDWGACGREEDFDREELALDGPELDEEWMASVGQTQATEKSGGAERRESSAAEEGARNAAAEWEEQDAALSGEAARKLLASIAVACCEAPREAEAAAVSVVSQIAVFLPPVCAAAALEDFVARSKDPERVLDLVKALDGAVASLLLSSARDDAVAEAMLLQFAAKGLVKLQTYVGKLLQCSLPLEAKAAVLALASRIFEVCLLGSRGSANKSQGIQTRRTGGGGVDLMGVSEEGLPQEAKAFFERALVIAATEVEIALSQELEGLAIEADDDEDADWNSRRQEADPRALRPSPLSEAQVKAAATARSYVANAAWRVLVVFTVWIGEHAEDAEKFGNEVLFVERLQRVARNCLEFVSDVETEVGSFSEEAMQTLRRCAQFVGLWVKEEPTCLGDKLCRLMPVFVKNLEAKDLVYFVWHRFDSPFEFVEVDLAAEFRLFLPFVAFPVEDRELGTISAPEVQFHACMELSEMFLSPHFDLQDLGDITLRLLQKLRQGQGEAAMPKDGQETAEEEASCLLPSSVLGFAKAATPLHCLDSVKGGTDLLNFCFYLHDALLFQVEKAESSSRLSLDIAVLPDDFRLRLGEVSSLLRFPEKAASKCLAPELLIPLLHVAPLTVFCASVVSRFSEEFAVAASKDGGRASLQRLWETLSSVVLLLRSETPLCEVQDLLFSNSMNALVSGLARHPRLSATFARLAFRCEKGGLREYALKDGFCFAEDTPSRAVEVAYKAFLRSVLVRPS